MDTIKSYSACSGATIQRCDAGVLCGSLAVVYVPVPLFRSDVCNSCQRNCVKCVPTEDVDKETSGEGKEKQHSPSSSSEQIHSVYKPVNHLGMNQDATGYLLRPEDASYVQKTEANNNDLCGLTLCNGGHLVGLTGKHGLLWCPKLQPACRAHCGSQECEAEEKRNIRQRGKKEKEPRFSQGKKSRGRRRLSSDSGRINWSDSGESGYSDIHSTDILRQTDTTSSKTSVSTSSSQPVAAIPAIQTTSAEVEGAIQSPGGDPSISPISPEFSHRNDVNTRCAVPEQQRQHKPDSNSECRRKPQPEARPRHSAWALPSPPVLETTHPRNRDVTSTVNKDDIVENYVAETRSHDTPQREHRLLRRERIQSSSPTPMRATSELALRRVGSVAIKPVGIKLDCLQEDTLQDLAKDNTPPRRPRSRSLFVSPNPAEMRLFKATTRSSRHRSAMQSQVPQVDFSKLTELLDAWEIGGDSPGKESIKCYGVAAVPRLNGFAITDADKVKIKTYGIDGDMKISFGTPTWPRHGRGITLTQDGKHIAVCHLFEVCTYTLDGVSVDRFKLEQFTACWGITSDTEGNFVITDPKSSCVFIMTPNGEITRRIGGPRAACPKQPRSRSSSGWRKSKSEKSLASKKLKSPMKKYREKTDSVRCLSNVSLPIVATRNISGDSDDGKKQVRLLAPRYVAVNSKNQILVTDTMQRCLLVFEQDGTLLFSIGGGRTGCEKCNINQEDDGLPQLVTTTEFWSVSSNSIEKDELARKNAAHLSNQPVKSHSTSILSEICGSKRGCISKSDRVKAIGATYRGHIGRNESVESEPYQMKSLQPMSATDQQRCSEFSPSKSVGSRLCAYADPTPGQCSPRSDAFERVSQESVKDNSRSKLKQIANSLKNPLWLRRKKRKRVENAAVSQIGKCDSLTVLSVFEDTADGRMRKGFSRQEDNISPTTTLVKSAFTPDTQATFFTYGSVNGRSEPASPEDGCADFSQPFYFQSAEHSDNTSEGDVSYDSIPEPVREPESEEDEDRAACRRCHVEDPRGVCVDKNDNILLVDRARHRVTVFNPEGHFLHHLLTQNDGLNGPMTVCILHDGLLVVTDSSASVKVLQFAQNL